MISEINSIMQLVGYGNVLMTRPCGRYGIDVVKKDGSKSCFFFSAPIRNAANSYIQKNFVQSDKIFVFQGTNAKVEVRENGITLSGANGVTEVSWKMPQHFVCLSNGSVLQSKDMQITPTLNGIMVKQRCESMLEYDLHTTFKREFSPRFNSKSFAYMKGRFEPYFTMDVIYAEDLLGHTMLPAWIRTIDNGLGDFKLRMAPYKDFACRLVWEINMYEPKLIQDTTVESMRPQENNVFGNMAFIGRNEGVGMQILYSRFDFGRIDYAHQQNMAHVLLHIPYYALGNDLKISAPFRRFCSFGSNWGNRMPFEDYEVSVARSPGYYTLDVSSHLIDKRGNFMLNTGIVISPKYKDGVTVLATADNYNTPQIIEIQYRKEKDNE